MNLILLLVVIAEACLGICAWLSPQWLRSIAARLLTRADVLDFVRKEEQRRMQFWTVELGLNRQPEAEHGESSAPGGFLLRH